MFYFLLLDFSFVRKISFSLGVFSIITENVDRSLFYIEKTESRLYLDILFFQIKK